MIVDELKKRITLAMKEKRVLEKEILKVALGEIQTKAARDSKEPTELTDEESSQIIRKLIKSNSETIAGTTDPEKKATLEEENTILGTLLPKGLSLEEIQEKLEAVRDAIRAAGNDGQATGVAAKHLKTLGLTIPGSDVAQVVKAIRAT